MYTTYCKQGNLQLRVLRILLKQWDIESQMSGYKRQTQGIMRYIGVKQAQTEEAAQTTLKTFDYSKIIASLKKSEKVMSKELLNNIRSTAFNGRKTLKPGY